MKDQFRKSSKSRVESILVKDLRERLEFRVIIRVEKYMKRYLEHYQH